MEYSNLAVQHTPVWIFEISFVCMGCLCLCVLLDCEIETNHSQGSPLLALQVNNGDASCIMDVIQLMYVEGDACTQIRMDLQHGSWVLAVG